MNAELIYTQEFALAVRDFILRIYAAQEKVCVGGDDRLAFTRAKNRALEMPVSMLQKACSDLAPSEGEEIGKFIRALEYGELPRPKNSTTDGTDNTDFGRTPRRHSQQKKNRKVCQRESHRELGGSVPRGRGQRLKPSGEMRLARDEDPTRVYDQSPSCEFRATAGRQPLKARDGSIREIRGSESSVPENLQAWLDQKSVEVMAQWR